MTRIMSAGDFHYGAGLDADVDHSVQQIAKIVENTRPDIFVFTGDMFERESQTKPRNLVKERIKQIANCCPIVMIYGNHDAPGDLDIFQDLKAYHQIRVCSKPEVFTIHSTNIYMIPWVYKSNWASMHNAQEVTESNEQISKQLLLWIRALKIKNSGKGIDHHIVASHITINGAKAENNQPLIGEGITLGQYDLEEAGFDAGFFGHIHLRQTFANGNFYYNGSPAAMDFGETCDKYASTYHTDSKEVEWHKLDAIQRVQINGEWKEGQWNTADMALPQNWDHTRVKVVYRISSKEDYKLAKKTIGDLYSQYKPLELKLSPQVISEYRGRAKDVTIQKSYEGKLRAYWKDTDTIPSPKEADEIIAKLKHIEEKHCRTTQLSLEM